MFFCVPLQSAAPAEPVRRAAHDGAVEGLNSRVRRCVLLEIATLVEPLRRAAHDGALEGPISRVRRLVFTQTTNTFPVLAVVAYRAKVHVWP